jgi:hypothetical protein
MGNKLYKTFAINSGSKCAMHAEIKLAGVKTKRLISAITTSLSLSLSLFLSLSLSFSLFAPSPLRGRFKKSHIALGANEIDVMS